MALDPRACAHLRQCTSIVWLAVCFPSILAQLCVTQQHQQWSYTARKECNWFADLLMPFYWCRRHWSSSSSGSVTTCKWKLQGLVTAQLLAIASATATETTVCSFIHLEPWTILRLSPSEQLFCKMQCVCAPFMFDQLAIAIDVSSLEVMVTSTVCLLLITVAAQCRWWWQLSRQNGSAVGSNRLVLARMTVPGERQPIEKMRLTFAGTNTRSFSFLFPCSANSASIDLRQINFMAQWAKKVHSLPRWHFLSLTFPFFFLPPLLPFLYFPSPE